MIVAGPENLSAVPDEVGNNMQVIPGRDTEPQCALWRLALETLDLGKHQFRRFWASLSTLSANQESHEMPFFAQSVGVATG